MALLELKVNDTIDGQLYVCSTAYSPNRAEQVQPILAAVEKAVMDVNDKAKKQGAENDKDDNKIEEQRYGDGLYRLPDAALVNPFINTKAKGRLYFEVTGSYVHHTNVDAFMSLIQHGFSLLDPNQFKEAYHIANIEVRQKANACKGVSDKIYTIIQTKACPQKLFTDLYGYAQWLASDIVKDVQLGFIKDTGVLIGE